MPTMWQTNVRFVFFFNDTATTEIYTLSLHDALPTWAAVGAQLIRPKPSMAIPAGAASRRSEEHTSELQSLAYLVCRLLLEKTKNFSVPYLLPSTTSCSRNSSAATGLS